VSTATWVDTTLGEIAEIVGGATPKTSVEEYWGGEIHWATPKDLSNLDGAEIHSTPRTLTEAGIASCSARVLPSNSVLLSSRAPIGHVAINTVPMATNQGFKSLIPNHEHADAKFLYWWLRRHRPALEAMGTGATFKEISKKTTAAVPIKLPPIEEQRRIAAVLDAADELRAKRREALAKLDTLTQAIFINMFGDAAAGKGREMRLVSLAQVVDAPITRGIDQPGPDVEGGVPYLKTTDFRGARPQRENLARSSPDIAAKFPRSVVAAGDSVICIRATVGPTMYMDEELDGVNLSRGTARISPSKEILPKFLFTALNSVHFQRQIERKLRGATFLQIPLKELKQLLVPLPPVPAQQRLVEAVEAVEAQRSSAERSQAFFDDLFASLQKRAFRGEL
jgi:type I restriction enzyme, S subunit